MRLSIWSVIDDGVSRDVDGGEGERDDDEEEEEEEDDDSECSP